MTKDKSRIQSCVDHINTAIDVDPWAKELVAEMGKEILEQLNNSNDCISRQAAADTLTEYGNGRAVYIGVGEAVRRIEQLPSAEPEHTMRFADDDHVWIDGKQYISLKRFQEAVVEAQPERKPGRCSMRLIKWQYCKDLNEINKAISEKDENWEGLVSAKQIISITYDTNHCCYVVFWEVEHETD